MWNGQDVLTWRLFLLFCIGDVQQLLSEARLGFANLGVKHQPSLHLSAQESEHPWPFLTYPSRRYFNQQPTQRCI